MHWATVFAIFVVAFGLTSALPADELPLVDDDLVQRIKSSNPTWNPSLNKFSKWKQGQAKLLAGSYRGASMLPKKPVQIVKNSGKTTTTKATTATTTTTTTTTTSSFDARMHWPGAIRPIQDQGSLCGSCWAFAAASVLSDRFAIASNLAVNVVLSPQQLISCDTAHGNQGCNGGYSEAAWLYLQSNGIPTLACYPYSSLNTGANGKCLLKNTTDGQPCPSMSGTTKFYRAVSAYTIGNTVGELQQEIMTNGPIEVVFTVYMDFFAYTSGVYSHVTGGVAGEHAVKMLGWGVLNGVPYWICANSWGVDWGVNGYFYIKLGTNEGGIESNAVAGLTR